MYGNRDELVLVLFGQFRSTGITSCQQDGIIRKKRSRIISGASGLTMLSSLPDVCEAIVRPPMVTHYVTLRAISLVVVSVHESSLVLANEDRTSVASGSLVLNNFRQALPFSVVLYPL